MNTAEVYFYLHLGDVGVEGCDAAAAQSVVRVAVGQRVAHGLAHLVLGELLLLRKHRQLLICKKDSENESKNGADLIVNTLQLVENQSTQF